WGPRPNAPAISVRLLPGRNAVLFRPPYPSSVNGSGVYGGERDSPPFHLSPAPNRADLTIWRIAILKPMKIRSAFPLLLAVGILAAQLPSSAAQDKDALKF